MKMSHAQRIELAGRRIRSLGVPIVRETAISFVFLWKGNAVAYLPASRQLVPTTIVEPGEYDQLLRLLRRGSNP